MAPTGDENWGAVAPAYQQVERLTTPPAQTLIDRASALLRLNPADSSAFDNGCGTGVLTKLLKEQIPQVSLLATDASDGMIDILQGKIKEQGWRNVTARVVDSRKLDEIKDGSFTHTFSAFMVCLAPEPDKIVREMWRVTKAGGVLGLAVWGEPYFRAFSGPWKKACREFDSDYEPPMVMDAKWTYVKSVGAGLEEAGFEAVESWEESLPWRWEGVEAVSKYFFEGGNPGNLAMIDSFKTPGVNIDEVRSIFDRIVQEESGQKDGSIELHAPATLAIARR